MVFSMQGSILSSKLHMQFLAPSWVLCVVLSPRLLVARLPFNTEEELQQRDQATKKLWPRQKKPSKKSAKRQRISTVSLFRTPDEWPTPKLEKSVMALLPDSVLVQQVQRLSSVRPTKIKSILDTMRMGLIWTADA